MPRPKKNELPPELITAREVAGILRYHEKTVRRKAGSPEWNLTAYRFSSRKVLFNKTEVLALAKKMGRA